MLSYPNTVAQIVNWASINNCELVDLDRSSQIQYRWLKLKNNFFVRKQSGMDFSPLSRVKDWVFRKQFYFRLVTGQVKSHNYGSWSGT